ncbi:MAG: hypothetical protein KC766_13855 [Myxococcales bacterium]|nr:hypothetical protein [Myxococcales bacterium]
MKPLSHRLRQTSSLLAAVCFLTATPSSAQSASEVAMARKHFKAARQLEDAKNWEGASAELRAALAIKETPGLRYHLAYSQEQLGHYAAALRNYQRAKQLLDEGQQAADVSQFLGPAIERVQALVGELVIVVPDSASYQVFLDGNEVEPGRGIVVDPGLHKVRAVRDGREQRHEVVVKAQATQRLELEAQPEEKPEIAPSAQAPSAPPAEAAPASAEAGSLKLPVLLGEGVITLAGLGLGIGFTLQANKAGDEADEALADINAKDPERQCSSTQASVQSSCAQLADFRNQEFDARDIATVGFVTAGVGAVALIATWLLWPEQHDTARARPLGFWAHSDGQSGAIGVSGLF